MKRVRALANHPLAAPTLRFGIAGTAVAAAYVSLPVLLNGVFGVAIQLVIPIAYVLAVSLHFVLQRHFVFRHIAQFALSGREQAARYVAVGAVQYPTTALATALLPGALGLSERATFVCTTLALSVGTFLILRRHVFHPTDHAAHPSHRSELDLARRRQGSNRGPSTGRLGTVNDPAPYGQDREPLEKDPLGRRTPR